MNTENIFTKMEIMALAHRWADATYNKALGKPHADFDAMARRMKELLDTALPSHLTGAIGPVPTGETV